MDIIELQDSSEEGSDEEQEEEEELVVLESSSEESETEEVIEDPRVKNGEVNIIVSDSEDNYNNDIVLGSSSEDEEDRSNEPIIFLEPIPEVASTSTGSKPQTISDFDLEDYEHFVDPSMQDDINLVDDDDDQGQTSKVKEIATTSVEHLEEIIVSEETGVSQPEENEKVDSGSSSSDFRVIGDKIFISVESLGDEKLDSFSVIREIERSNLLLSNCLLFEGWTVKYVSLQILQSLHLKNENTRLLLNQLSSCSIDANKKLTDRNANGNDYPEETELERIEVSQTREMKRKGIKLPRGWKIFGVKKEAEIASNGGTYSYFRIDWEYRSPGGKIFNDLKKVLSVVKQNAPKFERWEVRKVNAPYVTLRQQYEDELDRILDTDVFSLSGIRPVRKFPLNFQYPLINSSKSNKCYQDEDMLPSRMSAMLKANPISLAQQEKMMRKSGPAIQRFHLSKISEVIGDTYEGWFSSKLVAMKFMAKYNDKDVLSPSEYFSSRSGNIVKLKIVSDEDVPFIQDLDYYVEKRHGIEDTHEGSDARYRPNTKYEQRILPPPNFSRKLARNIILPTSWFIKKDKRLKTIISPQGTVFSNMESASTHIRYLNAKIESTPRKSCTPSKRKLYNLDLPQKTTVIRKLPTASDFPYPRVKKLKLSEEEVEGMLNSNMDSDDSLEELLSDSEDEQT